MIRKKLHIIITLGAALTSAVISVLNADSLYSFCVKFLLVIVVFYTLGSLVKLMLDKNVFYEKPAENEPSENELPGNNGENEGDAVNE